MPETQSVRPHRVYITNENGYIHKAAEEYGEIVYMTAGFIDTKNISLVTQRLRGFIDNAKKGDYLLLTGHIVIGATACMLWKEKFGECSVLMWDKQQTKYVPIHLYGDDGEETVAHSA